ncbi:MAG: alanine--tRNA ligase-related protein, partial [Candidatus Paceibacterota bacterium]
VSDDPSVLFTTAGMQQFKPYYLGEKSPYGNNVASVQKCFRTSDIDSVGDESHLTFFEMLGNFSFGGYFKEKAIEYAYEFITKKLGLKIAYVSVFEGDSENGIPADEESEKIWKKIAPETKIEKAGIKDNFWGPTGEEGPCGPTTEIYINGIEIWNIVFNEYYKDKNGKFTKLETPGVDTGMGLERLAMVVQNKPTIFETDLFIELIPNGLPTIMDNKIKRMILDHGRGITFLISDGLKPSNKDQGYVLRRLIRRMMAHFYQSSFGSFSGNDILGQDFIDIENILINTAKIYKNFYPNLDQELVLSVFREENNKFRKAIHAGIKEIKKINFLDAQEAFKLYESYGLTYEIIKDFAREKAKDLNRDDFDEEFVKHQEISRAGLEKKFGGHGLNEGGAITGATEEEKQKITRLHTATHLLHQALFDVLGDQIRQLGSDINSERLRFDFPFERKLTPEELTRIENIVNQKIKEALPVEFEEKSKNEAITEGARAFFKVKYPDKVKVYSIGDWSKEICNGPHVKNTSEIGNFKILKEESVGAGIRRIKATVE